MFDKNIYLFSLVFSKYRKHFIDFFCNNGTFIVFKSVFRNSEKQAASYYPNIDTKGKKPSVSFEKLYTKHDNCTMILINIGFFDSNTLKKSRYQYGVLVWSATALITLFCSAKHYNNFTNYKIPCSFSDFRCSPWNLLWVELFPVSCLFC